MLSEKINQNIIILKIFDSPFSIEEISKKLQLEPTSVKVKGELTANGQLQKHDVWQYERKSETNDFIGEHAEAFISEVIEPRLDVLADICKESNAEFTFVQYYYDGVNPGYCLSKEAIKILGKANLSLDIDTYCLSSTEASR